MTTFEPARQEDILPLFQLNRELIDKYEDCAAIDYDRVLSWVRNNIAAQLPHFRRVLADGELAGYFCLCPGDDAWELDSLFVFPEFQNRGIGTKIIRHCQAQSEDPLFLYVFKDNTGALRLYKRLGFEIVREARKTAYVMEFKKQDC